MAGSDLVQSLTRGLVILEHVARSGDGSTIQEIAAILEVKPPTAHNLVRTLVDRGYLERRESPIRYVLGRGVLELAERTRRWDLSKRAHDELLKIASQRPSANAIFAQAIGGEIMATLRVSPERPGVVQHPSSQVMSPYTSASGLLYQAFWTDRDRAAYRARYPFAEYGAGEWKMVDRLERFLAEARKLQAIVLEDESLCRVAVPVHGPGGDVIAGLGVSGRPGGRARADYLKLARQAASQITGTTSRRSRS